LIQIDLQALGQILKGIDFENENTNKENVTASVLKNLVDLLIAAGDNAKITFSDKLNGSTYSVSTKIDGEIIRIIVKLLVLYSKNGNNTE
jgi:glucose uptake protein GlcU